VNKRSDVRSRLAGTGSRTSTEPDHDSGSGAPSSEEIARLAYSYWEARGYQGGSPEEDWLRAERELSERLIQERALPARQHTPTLTQAG
jgi:hypothetical protein